MSSIHRPQVQKLASLTGHRDCVYALAGTPGQEVFYSAGADGMVAAWSADEPERDGELVAKVENSVYALLHLPERQLLLLGHNFQGLQAIDLQEKKLAYATALPPPPFLIWCTPRLGSVFTSPSVMVRWQYCGPLTSK
ncbi:hypothetical protein [Hymenobacter sp. 5414T-23]|uniref:hypothetical protein n=1 Tax=Hymenobacter sp. 5414T-23 TaxID=2932252 RepID=UPI00293ED809|nr:hypothetical protein [Hymenobacter sp. 5414T-23]